MMMNQYPRYPTSRREVKRDGKSYFILILIVFVLALFITWYVTTKLRKPKPFCGDGTCDSGETCRNCPKDCGTCPPIQTTTTSTTPITITGCGNDVCEPGENEYNCCLDCPCSKPGEVCNYETNSCVKRGNVNVCGDGLCDWGEDVWSCCIDCRYCPEGMRCDLESKTCVYIEISLTDDEVISLFKEFLIEYGYDPQEVNVGEYETITEAYEGIPAKYVCKKAEEIRDIVCGYVLENKTVVGPIRYW